MRYQEGRSSLGEFAHRFVDLQFAFDVDLTGELIQNQNAWIAEHGTSQGDSLFLTAGELRALVADKFVVPLRLLHDEVVSEGTPGRRFNFLAGCSAFAISDVLFNRVVEQHGILRDQPDLSAQAAEDWPNGD